MTKLLKYQQESKYKERFKWQIIYLKQLKIVAEAENLKEEQVIEAITEGLKIRM